LQKQLIEEPIKPHLNCFCNHFIARQLRPVLAAAGYASNQDGFGTVRPPNTPSEPFNPVPVSVEPE
jgi:hypothetical protein